MPEKGKKADGPSRAARRGLRPYFAVEPDLLTEAEIAALRREAKETSAYFQKAFAHLRPKD